MMQAGFKDYGMEYENHTSIGDPSPDRARCIMDTYRFFPIPIGKRIGVPLPDHWCADFDLQLLGMVRADHY